MYKNQHQMDQRPQCESQNYENDREYVVSTLPDIGIGKDFLSHAAAMQSGQ